MGFWEQGTGTILDLRCVTQAQTEDFYNLNWYLVRSKAFFGNLSKFTERDETLRYYSTLKNH